MLTPQHTRSLGRWVAVVDPLVASLPLPLPLPLPNPIVAPFIAPFSQLIAPIVAPVAPIIPFVSVVVNHLAEKKRKRKVIRMTVNTNVQSQVSETAARADVEVPEDAVIAQPNAENCSDGAHVPVDDATIRLYDESDKELPGGEKCRLCKRCGEIVVV